MPSTISLPSYKEMEELRKNRNKLVREVRHYNAKKVSNTDGEGLEPIDQEFFERVRVVLNNAS